MNQRALDLGLSDRWGGHVAPLLAHEDCGCLDWLDGKGAAPVAGAAPPGAQSEGEPRQPPSPGPVLEP